MTVKKLNKKCNLTIGKKFTINSGNYSSIQPNVSLTVNDIPVNKISEIKEAVNVIVNSMFIEQVYDCLDDMDAIQRNKMEETFGSLDSKEAQQEFEEAVDVINNI